MKIAVLNECFLNENHLARLKTLGEIKIFNDTTTKEQVISRLEGVDIAIVDGFLAPLDKEVFANTDNLKLLILPHNGYFMVDIQAAAQKGIKVANAPGFSTEAVAELVIGLMFAVNRKIALMDKLMRIAPFESDPGVEAHQKLWGYDLKNKTIGIIGLGKIGSRVAEIAQGVGMKVIAYNKSPKDVEKVEMVNLDELLKKADIISINATTTEENTHMISKRELDMMKPTAIFINVSQAQNVDPDALYEALSEKRIYGAGLDIVEGLNKNHPMLKLENVVFTGHAGSSTEESFRVNLPEIVVSNIEDFVKGTQKNIIN